MHSQRDLSKNGCNGFEFSDILVDKVIEDTAIKPLFGNEFNVGSTIRDATLTRLLEI